MSEPESTLPLRYEVRISWEGGKKRFAVHDLQESDCLVESFDSVKDASIHCSLLWLDHVRAIRGVRTTDLKAEALTARRVSHWRRQ